MITDLQTVKTIGRLFDLKGEGEPGVDTSGSVGEVYMDTATGKTYLLESESPKVWKEEDDSLIELSIERAEKDYLKIRGIAFEDDFPDGSSYTAAEMVCYLLDIGHYEGRGRKSEGLAGRSMTYDDKLIGYPHSIAGQIDRFVDAS